ncbi:hypothetical protein L6164_009190 [Bauhinia variegata]|uniref:Uncharacterized protein n=1 Tax=Bauhinia variegata TaxID=167791 RepID=A0ACB9PK89_BAUVA|nr:hypothetical protein L6164_009190 [Bauhinia variegata]
MPLIVPRIIIDVLVLWSSNSDLWPRQQLCSPLEQDRQFLPSQGHSGPTTRFQNSETVLSVEELCLGHSFSLPLKSSDTSLFGELGWIGLSRGVLVLSSVGVFSLAHVPCCDLSVAAETCL